MDVARQLRVAVDTGRVVFGVKETGQALESGAARLVVVSNDCPDDALRSLDGDRVHHFAGNTVELGAACGKPFYISALAILDPGESDILSL